MVNEQKIANGLKNDNRSKCLIIFMLTKTKGADHIIPIDPIKSLLSNLYPNWMLGAHALRIKGERLINIM